MRHVKNRFRPAAVRILVPAVLGLAAAVWWWGGGAGTPAEPKFLPEAFNFRTARAHWIELIDREGAEAAYRDFKETYRAKDLKSQHIGAHIFGDVLYAKEGLQGFLVCDEAFAFGCYHIFLTRALAEQGLDAITMLHDACKKKFGTRTAGCEHGIGHGLVEYFGYDRDELTRALTACPPAAGPASPFVGCRSGAFMEYYSRVSFDENRTALEWREFDPGNPYDPCPSVPESFRRPCYAQLGLWWDRVTDADYARMGNLCAGIPERADRDVCFFSLGMFGATLSEYDGQKTRARCGQMPHPEAALLCRSGAYRSFQGSPYNAAEAGAFCSELAGDDARRCASIRPDTL